MTVKIEELLSRLEALQGPDRALDADIWLACVPGVTRKQWSYIHEASGRKCEIDETRDAAGYLVIVPTYTKSLDAALMLVPEGSYGFAFPWFYSEYSDYGKPCVFWRAAVHKPIWEKATPTLAGDDWFERAECNENMLTPAIALCIAALRARLSQVNT